MIKPNEVQPRGSLPRDIESQIAALERRCDDAIREADQSERWPAVVRRMRMVISDQAKEAVMLKYRLAGWKVFPAGDRQDYMEIDRP